MSHFWRPDVRLRSYWAKVKILAGLAPSEGPRGECFLPFPASRGNLHSVSSVNSLLPCNLKYSLWVLEFTAFIPLSLLPPPHSLHRGENTTVPKAQIRISRPPEIEQDAYGPPESHKFQSWISNSCQCDCKACAIVLQQLFCNRGYDLYHYDFSGYHWSSACFVHPAPGIHARADPLEKSVVKEIVEAQGG